MSQEQNLQEQNLQEQNLQEQSRQGQSADGQFRLVALSADVGRALTTRDTQADMLRGCVEAMVTHLDAAFARIWVLDEAENVLVLCASAGQYTHLDGPHGRVPVGQFKIGLIAQECQPHLTNAVVGDPRVSDQEWARREGMVAFAGYPLVVDGRLVGVVALFARQPLADATLLALGSVADQIGVGVERLRADGERRASQEALAESQGRLRDAQARLEAALEAGGIGTWTYDLSADRVVADAGLARLFSVTSEDAAGGSLDAYLQAIHPDDRPLVTRAIADAVASGEVYEAQYRVVLPDGSHRWLATRGRVERDAAGEAVALPGVVLDVTERVEREQRERFLADLAERARTLTDPEAVIADAVRSLGGFLGVSRCILVDIDLPADSCTINRDYYADETAVSMAGTFTVSAFGPSLVEEYAAGRTVVVEDVRFDLPPDYVVAYDAVDVRAFVAVPVLRSSRLVSVLAVHSPTARRWEAEDVAMLQTVVERTWLTVEVLRQQQALAHEAEEVREAHARTTGILESISDGFIALDREWRFTYINDQAERLLFRTREELLGRGIWEEFPEAVGGTFYHLYRRAMDEEVAVSVEDYYAPLDAWLDVRVYPSGGGLSIFLQNVSERKALEAERERLAERERNIAQQLQAALTPSIPEHIPGMALAKYYEAALDEAGVGGDFYDVFPLDKGCTTLVVGDLSGKGLAAASQVATVRNMLRYALYRAHTLTGALQSLNSLLVEQGLLTSFATLFVGAYDSGAGTLTYVNCGQEPALIRRAAGGLVERLMPTAPVLGAFEGLAFEERTVALGTGDSLAIFTDGLTEVGRSRTEMLGVEGVADLLAGGVPAEADSAEAVAEYVALRLIAGVDSAAQGGVMRDDVCLLVAVVV